MGSTKLHEGQVLEVLFDADDYLTPVDWLAPPCEPSRHVPLHIFIPPSSRRSSTASTTSSLSSPLLLSPTRPPSPARCAWDAARRTAPRPTSTFVPCARGLDETALFLVGVPGAEEQVRRLARDPAVARCARELLLVQQTRQWWWVPVKAVPEITETMQIQRLREEIARAESKTRRGPGSFRGLRKRFQLRV